MKPVPSRSRGLGLQRMMLVLLPLMYMIFSLVQVHVFHTPPSTESIGTFQVFRKEQNIHEPVPRQGARAEDKPENAQATAAQVALEATTAMRGRRTMVLLVNYRDSKRCGETLTTLFANAVHPELLRVSIHDQIDQSLGDLPCIESYCDLVGERDCRRDQIVWSQVHAKDAKGPTVARHIVEQEIRDEEFCLGLDSHLVFVPSWDVQLVQNWESVNNDKAILTVYPKSTEYLEDHSKDNKMGLLCSARIETADKDAMVQFLAVKWLPKTNTTKPMLMAQFAGGFNFGSCQSYKDVPNDQYTPILFYGEEYARAARLWTHGYDLYVPSVDVAYHWFEERKKIWDEDWPAKYWIMQRSKRRVRAMLGLSVSSDDYDKTELDKYGLGTKRTFAQFEKFSGIDPRAKFIPNAYDQFANCRELEYVPYET